MMDFTNLSTWKCIGRVYICHVVDMQPDELLREFDERPELFSASQRAEISKLLARSVRLDIIAKAIRCMLLEYYRQMHGLSDDEILDTVFAAEMDRIFGDPNRFSRELARRQLDCPDSWFN